MSSVEEGRQYLVNEIDKRLHISRLTNGFYEKTSDILMKRAFGFLMDQWISAGLLAPDFRGNDPTAEEEEKSEKDQKKRSNEKEEKPGVSRRDQGRMKGLIDKFDKNPKRKLSGQEKKLNEFEEKFTQGLEKSGLVKPSTSATEPGSAPPEINAPEEELDDQEKILNDISLEELFDDEAFENQCDADKQLVKVEDKEVVAVEEEKEKQIIPIDEIEEHERQAQALKEQAQAALNQNAVEFEEAYKLQQDALLAAHDANVKTAKALVNQEIGTQLLAEAGKCF